jgi:hypothetical protein
MKTSIFVAALGAAAALASGAAAQERINLSAGFMPDPVTRQIFSGGGRDASDISSGCSGMIAETPDIVLNFDSSGGRLAIGARSSGDTSLVINGPDGRWFCNDDTNGLNPALVWGRAPSGQYDIWVGAVGEGAMATVSITEGSL